MSKTLNKKILNLAITVSLIAIASPSFATEGQGGGKGMEGKEGRGGKGHHGQFFQKIDTDGDGAVSKSEHQAFSDKKFSEMDSDNDGKVTREEGRSFHQQMKGKREEMRDKFKEMRDNRKGGKDAPTNEQKPQGKI